MCYTTSQFARGFSLSYVIIREPVNRHGTAYISGGSPAIGIIALAASGIPMNFCLLFPLPLVYVLDQAFPIIEGDWFLYEHERILYAVWECVLEPMAECVITPIDLAGQHVKLNEEVGEFLIGLHVETIEVRFCGSFCIWVSEHIMQFLDKTCPIMQPVRQHKIGVLFVFELCIEVALGGSA